MDVTICMLRGVNIGGHHKIKMEALRALCEKLKLRDAQTYIQSGNVVFRTSESDLARLGKKIEDAIEREAGFRPAVMLRSAEELRGVIARNPFARRAGLDPARLAVTFLAAEPSAEARKNVLGLDMAPEELRLDGREMFVYYPNGMARPSVPQATIERALKTAGTARNLNTVRKLLEMAEALEAAD